MRLDGRRESNNVEDRRGMSSSAKAGIGGIGGIVLIALFTLLQGGNLGDVIGNVVQQGGQECSSRWDVNTLPLHWCFLPIA